MLPCLSCDALALAPSKSKLLALSSPLTLAASPTRDEALDLALPKLLLMLSPTASPRRDDAWGLDRALLKLLLMLMPLTFDWVDKAGVRFGRFGSDDGFGRTSDD